MIYRRIKSCLNDKLLQVKWWPYKFRPFSDKKKNSDTCVIANGIPKSGTCLGGRIVQYFDKWRMLPICIADGRWVITSEWNADIVLYEEKTPPNLAMQRLRNGQAVVAHISWLKRNEKVIVRQTPKRRIKHIFMYRDPRDAWVSTLNYIMQVEGSSSYSNYKPIKDRLMKYSSYDERLEYIIKSVDIHFFTYFIPWLRNPNCHAVKFEDLYSDVLKLQDNIIGDTLSKLFAYLEVDKDSINPIHMFKFVHNKSKTASSEEDKIGQYLRCFKKRHYDLIDNAKARNILQKMGYKW